MNAGRAKAAIGGHITTQTIIALAALLGGILAALELIRLWGGR